MFQILSLLLLFITFTSCNQPFLYEPDPKPKVNPLVGILGASAALLADLELDSASCLDAESISLTQPSISSTGFVSKTSAYTPKQVKFYKFESNKSLWVVASFALKNGCMIVGKENKFISTNSSLGDTEDIPKSCGGSVSYSFLINAGQFRCIGTIATESGNGTLSISETSNGKPLTYTSISPSSGPVGTAVTIKGENFSTFGYSLTFPSASFSQLSAYIEYVDFYTIKTKIPLFGITGSFQMNYKDTGLNFTVTSPTLPTWSQENCTYSPITGTEVAMNYTDDGYVGIPLGFNFNMGGVVFDALYVSTNGRADFYCPRCSLTSQTMQTSGSSSFFSSTDNYSYSLAPWFNDSIKVSDASIRYLVQGSVGSRVFILQYSNYPESLYSSTARLNYQIHLKEGTNIIEFHYGTKVGTGSTSQNTIAGIRVGNGGTGNIRNAIDGSTTANSFISTQVGFASLSGKCIRFTP